jgi:L-rhamnonate dehydratase
MRRRSFLSGAVGLPAAVPFAQEPPRNGGKTLQISAVEVWRVEGHREAVRGVNGQFQVNPLHLYDEFRPKPYREGQAALATVPASALYLKIRTDAGLDGFYGPIDTEAAIVVDQQLRGFLIGKDPLAGEALWDQMYRLNRHSRHGHFMMALSAVDNTLWDLRGRYFSVPVYRLLGGPTRASAETYASCLGYSIEPEAARARATDFKGRGFRYQKWFLAHGPGDGPEGMARNVELVKTLREAVGPEPELMFDSFMGWNLNYALEWAKQVEPYRPYWMEESFPPDEMESFVQLRRATSVPVAAGEHLYGRWEAARYMGAGALNVLQSDPEWCGGVSELVKICAIASLHGVQVIPHGHGLHAALHVVASQSPAVCPLVEYLVLKMESYHYFEQTPPRLDGARLALPAKPGFGIGLDAAKAEKQSVVHWS